MWIGEDLGRFRVGFISGFWVLLLFMAVFGVALNVPAVRGTGDSWVWVRDTVTGAYGEAVVNAGEDLYIAIGTSFYRYRPADDNWVAMAAPPSPDGAAFETGTVLAQDGSNYIYALYGSTGGESRRWFYRYSISGNSWEALADTPADQGEGDAITWVSLDNRIYATVGGEERSTYFVRYDPSTNTWSDAAVADPPAGMGDGASLVWTSSNYLYALRGEFYETTALCDFWRYSITSNVWTVMADIPADPHDGGVGGVGDGGSLIYIGLWLSNQTNFIYALSGNQAYPESPQPIPDNRFYRYTISTNSWERLADLPFDVGYYVGSRLSYADGRIYAWQGTPSTWAGGGDDLARYELPPTTMPRTWTVDDDGPADFSKIQDAVDATTSGDTVYVYNGTYYENVVANKDNLTLVGENKEDTIIDARGVGNGLSIEASNITISNFTVTHAGEEGIKVLYERAIIRNNIIVENRGDGIDAYYAGGNMIEGNVISNNWWGVYAIFALGNIIDENVISNNWVGVLVDLHSENNIVKDNIIKNNGFYGVSLNSGNNTIEANEILNNSPGGVYLSHSPYNRIVRNLVSDNGFGIYASDSIGNEIAENFFSGEHSSSLYFEGGNSNKIFHNNFVDSGRPIMSISFNIWDDGYPSGGNYWSDYIGQDQNGDGIGDTPYIIDANNQDRYPLMYQWPDTTPPTGSISIAGGASYTNSLSVTLTLFAEDASGVTKMRFSHDNITWMPWETYFTSKTWVLTTGDGTKTVYVQYRDKAGLISPSYQDIIILDATKPTANAGNDQTVNEDTIVAFDGSASQDENGIQSYAWTFTDVTSQTLTGRNPTYTFQTPGTYTVTLNVTDAAGNYATDSVTITVLDVTKPQANAGSDRTVNEDTQITFDGSASTDNVAIAAYKWTFTDVTIKTLTGEKPAYTFNTLGVYTITLNVTDAAGNWATDTITITVLPSEVPLPPPAEAFPMWIAGIVVAIIAVGAAATIFLRKRK